jgi:hypothetical protein
VKKPSGAHTKSTLSVAALTDTMRMIGCKRNVSYFVFEFINCTNVPPYSRDAPTLLAVVASEREKDALHAVAILCRTLNGSKFGRWIAVAC